MRCSCWRAPQASPRATPTGCAWPIRNWATEAWAAGDVTRAQHCRAEFYAASHGWVPVDPADVRKVMLEEPPGELPINNPQARRA